MFSGCGDNLMGDGAAGRTLRGSLMFVGGALLLGSSIRLPRPALQLHLDRSHPVVLPSLDSRLNVSGL